MESTIDYFDIQGNVMVNYAEFGFLKARYLLFTIIDVDKGREFVKKVQPLITAASSCMSAQKFVELRYATNIAFSYMGLKRLGLPILTLQSFPDEFIIGMRGQRSILGDDDQSNPDHWDPVWGRDAQDDVHIFISIDARNQTDLEECYRTIREIEKENGGIALLDGHRCQVPGTTLPYQDASALYDGKGEPTSKEHFGYSDGISNPFFKGMTADIGNLLGGGKKVNYGAPQLESTWAPLETGEFILGYQDEAQEYPAAPTPPLVGRNGSYLVFNKFHENVAKFDAYLEEVGGKFPGGKEALAAKFVGRWRNGAPITSFPTFEEAEDIAAKRQQALAAISKADQEKDPNALKKAQAEFRKINDRFVAFDYENDLEGSRCPMGAHIRRANPRGGLEFGNRDAFDTPTALDNRRRMIRRGLPYGVAKDRSSPGGEHGTIIMTIVASIKRQFEFVVQQWLNYGNDFKLANDKDPIMGNHKSIDGVGNGRMVVAGKGDTDPYFLSGIPRFIETRGGEYFFIPSLTAVGMIGDGIVDPT